jgi:uncharacterized membrane protein YphA (DoxX/SURF4 family)
MNKIFRNAARLLVAVLFIFSGFVKCVDPSGFAIKMEEYLLAFGMESLIPLSLAFSILMCGAEMLVGFMLLFNLRIKWAIWITVALMAFYTPLTLWLAISNKVTDCGCFGDAITLTNWQTFLKNVVLDAFTVVLVLNRNRYSSNIKGLYQWGLTGGLAILCLWFEFFNLNHLPIIDFMPYKVGVNIPQAMIIPEGASQGKYGPTTLIYEKDGKKKEFTLQNYPADDSTWTFVETKTKVIEKPYEPPIHDFNINSSDGQDYTNTILSEPGKTLLVLSNSLSEASKVNIDEINRLVELAISKGYKVYGLTASLPEEVEYYKEKTRATYPIYNMDETTLKTMIRANPGIMIIQAGTILGKWHHKQLKKLRDI